ncbi:hypothetical protein EC991_006919 [Linnemannia zychae]|nr:hypothetical protein EC991_006919 [Linnemannia zychae]
MADNKHHSLSEHPRFFGIAAQLTKGMIYGKNPGEQPSDHIDDYFIDTSVCQWSVRDFLKTRNDPAPFIEGINKIRRRYSVDKTIRAYATSWFKFLEGDLGKLRLEGFVAETKTSVSHDVLVEEGTHLSQQSLRDRLRQATANALVSHQPIQKTPLLGKREREDETEVQEEDGFAISPTYKKSTVSPFNVLGGDSLEDEKEEDTLTLTQERTRHSLNIVSDCQPFSFTSVVGEQDVSSQFTDYYEEAVAMPYDHHSFEDFLATGGILFLGDKPTHLQERCFGEDFEKLRVAVISGIEPNKGKDILANQEDQAVEFCQAARNTFRKAEHDVGSSQARKLLKQRIAQEEDSSLKDLYEYAAKLPKECQPVSEADQKSSFVLGMLRPLFDRPDCSRLAHTATTAISGSLFVRLCQNFEAAPKYPDFLVRYQESTDIGVAEVSLEPNAQRDIGNLCRVALWSKRILDELVTRLDITEEAQVLFFQVIGKNCIFYTMRRSGTVCVVVEVAKIKIAYTISDVLAGFEEDVRSWLLVDRTFQNLISTLQSALPRKANNPPPPVFASL